VVLVGDAADGADGRDLAAQLSAAGVEATHLFGRTPEETSVALLETGFTGPRQVVLASAASAPEALLGGYAAAVRRIPLLLVPAAPPLPDFVAGALSAHARSIGRILVVGSPASVGNAVGTAAVDATVPIEPMSSDEVVPGMVGTGYTVVRGIDPEPFTVKVLDVIPDGIGDGVDLIMIRVSGPLIDDPEEGTKGIAYGFSGSPVYVDVMGTRKLMGAVAYGCWFCDQRIGGVTPADQMTKVLAYPAPTQYSVAGSVGTGSASMPQTAQSRSGGMQLRRLDVPMGLSGLTGRRFSKVAGDLERSGRSLMPFRSGAASSPAFTPFDPLFPGHSYAGVLSVGTLTASGIGTATYRDGPRSLGFGHPFFWQGPAGLGLHAAKVHLVLGDPSQTFGGYKVASVTGAHGVMNQDRLTAVAGIEGQYPHTAPVVSTLSNPDLGTERPFTTTAVMSELFPDVAAIHNLIGLDTVFDRIGEGTTNLRWTIQGRRAAGRRFTLERGNRYVSNWDTSFTAIWEQLEELYEIQFNASEPVVFDAVTTSGSIRQELRRRKIVQVEARSTSAMRWISTGTLTARPGDTIAVRVTMRRQPKQGLGATIVRTLRLQVPRRAAGSGSLTARGGGGGEDDFFFFFDHEEQQEDETLDDVLERLAAKDRNDELVAELRLYGGGGYEGGSSPSPAPGSGESVKAKRRFGTVITGQRSFSVRIVRR
ncbi:MAG: hypothetical protein M3245_06225, partial [Actinomycetota bacterium]|nr:hypothetical protein [Actinomycetota bacterium]